ncbi:MAG: hypothetical protein HYV60_25500 [Planctomycetia bacterium]|nr:hypothetical protein [Planctomycetia bacterium]
MLRRPISFASTFVLAVLSLDCGGVTAEPPKTPAANPSTEPRADVPT